MVVSRLRASPARRAAWPATPRAGSRAQLQNAFAYVLHSGLCLCVQPGPHCASATLAAAAGNLSTSASTVFLSSCSYCVSLSETAATLAAPQQVFGLGVDHIDDHGPLGVLGHRRTALDSPVASPTPSPAASPAAPPARPPPVPVIPVGDVELLVGAGVVCDAEVGVTVARDIPEACELLCQIGSERTVRDRVHEHWVVGR